MKNYQFEYTLAKPMRLDAFLQANIPDLSRSRLKALIQADEPFVLVNGTQSKASLKLRMGDTVCCKVPMPNAYHLEPENIPLDVIYDDKSLAVINKPKGLVVHPAPGHPSATLVHALLYHFKDSLSGINGTMRPGIVHRIDKDTSGLLVIAKTDAAHQGLSQQFAGHRITREYHAVAYGHFKNDAGTIDAPIGRSPKDRKKMAVVHANGKEAVTHYKVLEDFGNLSYIRLQLETGRTHQIRVHMAHIGHGLLGDAVYAVRKPPLQTGCQGQILHAKTLSFVHPKTKETMTFDSKLPDYFENVLQKLKSSKLM